MSDSGLPDIKIDAKVDSKDVAKVANRFIERVSRGLGKIYEPTHIRRIAKAEAEAMLIRTEAEIGVAELQKRAVQRLLADESRKQENLESTIEQATPFLEDHARPEEISDDFLGEWQDRAARVSDKDMQILWAKIIAGEANSPGTFRKRTLDAVSLIEKSEANIFVRLCGFVVQIGGPTPLIFDYRDDIYKSSGITFNSVGELEAAGLVFTGLGFQKTGVPKKFLVPYGRRLLSFDMGEKTDLSVGSVRLTPVGAQLFPLSNAPIADGFAEYIVQHYAKKKITVQRV